MSVSSASQAAATVPRDHAADSGAAAPTEESPRRTAQKAVPEASAARAHAANIQHWLAWQCQMISGVHRGAVYLAGDRRADGLHPAARWPSDSIDTEVMHNLAAKARRAGRGVVQKALDDDIHEVCDYIAYPISRVDRFAGVVVLAIEIRSEVQRQAVLQLVEWGAVWLETTLGHLREEAREGPALALAAIAELASRLPLPLAGHKLCNLLADSLECTQVAFGLSNGMHVHVVAVAHQLQFDRHRTGVVRIEAAMEECVDQAQPVALPVEFGAAGVLSQAHAHLLLDSDQGAVFSVPLQVDGHTLGALTLTWERMPLLDHSAARSVTELAQQIAPVIDLRRREGRSAVRRLSERLYGWTEKLFGAGYLRTKLTVTALALGLGLASVLYTDHRISAPSVIEGTLQQAVVAPVAGYVSAANARAGDEVQSGQVLAVLDGRELLLERDKWRSEREKHAKEYQEALASRDRAKISVASARITQTEAQLQLIDDQIERLTLRAPFSGTLISGDLSRALGAPVERGQLLFEIVPSEGFRVSLQVDEHDVADLAPGQAGYLRLTGLPDVAIPFEISRIVPVAKAEQGTNHFRVEAELQQLPEGLRPGMQGVAKVVVGQASLLYIWTDQLLDRLRLWLWSAGF